MIPILIIIISFILDGILSNFLPFITNDLSLFTPMLTVVSIFLIYPFYRKQEKKYFITIFIVGIIYDLFYTNLFLFNGMMFIVVGITSYFIHKNLDMDFFRLILYIILIISLYETTSVIIFRIFNLVPVTFIKLLYKISHSLILNIIYSELIYLIVNNLPKRFRYTSIN